MTGILIPEHGIVDVGMFGPGGPLDGRYDLARRALEHAEAEADIDALLALLEHELSVGWRLSPSSMGAYLSGGVLRRWRYVEYLSRKFVDAATGKSPRQIWNLPSRYGKTWLAEWGFIWVLDHTDGRARLMLVSWGDELARRTSIETRTLALGHGERLGFGLAGRFTQDEWDTDAGGRLFASGIDGGMFGMGAGSGGYSEQLQAYVRGGIVVDDPFKNWQQAHSEARRNHVENQFKGVVRSRLDEEEAFIIVIQQRVHEDDLSGRLLEDVAAETGDRWEHVNLPALAYDDGTRDPIGRKPGEPLERFDLPATLSRMEGMGEHVAAAQMQQRPLKAKGHELLREWFVLATASEMPVKPERAISSWDLKLKDKEAGDYVVGQTWWKVGQGRWCVDQMRGQYDHATTANAIALTQVRHPEVKRHFVEHAGSADEVEELLKQPQRGYVVTDEMAERLGMTDDERAKVARLRQSGMGNIVLRAVTDGAKPVRARLYIAPAAERGNVRIPEDAPWAAKWLEEMAGFPFGVHDDQVDAASLGLKELRKATGGAGMHVPEGSIPS